MVIRYGTYLKRLNKGYKIVESGCWEWQGKLTKKGYARFLYEGVRTFAHRVSYLLFIGEINDPKLHVCHKCDNPRCCSPFHLFLGTPKENDTDSRIKGRQPTLKHGTYSMYKNRKCRCALCIEAAHVYFIDYALRNKEKISTYQKQYKLNQKALRLANKNVA
jgi:hypothetical protein